MGNIRRSDAVIAITEMLDRLYTVELRVDDLMMRMATQERLGDQMRIEESMIDEAVLNIGRKYVLKDCTYSWNTVEASVDEESGDVSVISYEKWLKDKVKRIPDYASRDGFLSYFEDDLRKMYEEEKEDTLSRLKGGNAC